MKIPCALVAAAIAAGPAAGQAPRGYLVRKVSVVDVEQGRTVPDQYVYILGKRIQGIESVGVLAGRDDLKVIDGEGLYLMPGLFDAHVHLSASADTFGPLLVAAGVTAVRDTGAPTSFILGLRDQAASGDAVLPRIICTGAIIDGDPPIWPFSEPCDEPDEARAAVRRLKEAGVDMIKVYSLLPHDVYLAAIDEAHRAGLKVCGHVPLSVTLDEAMAAGQDCCEHLTGFDRALGEMIGWTPPDDASPWAWFDAWAEYGRATPAQLRELAARVKASGMVQCPTIVVMRGIGRTTDPQEADDPRMAYVPASLRALWGGPPRGAFAEHAGRAAAAMQKLTGQLHRAGVPLMVGTDLANPYVFAGWSVHEEMALFQEAGIEPADVLRAATIVPARFCGVAADLGTVGQGKVASLVLVRGDPLEDVANAQRIEGVFLRGRYFNRAAIDAQLEEVRSAVRASLPVEAPEIDMTLPGTEVYRGRYNAKFEQFDAGGEDFVITRDDDGYHLRIHAQPQGRPQAPYLVTYHVGPDFSFKAAEWRVLDAGGLEARYTAEDGVIRAEARRAGGDPETQELTLPAHALVGGPGYAVDFATTAAAGLEPGETREFQSVAFGYPSWKLGSAPYTLTRRQDTTLAVGGHDVTAALYESVLVTEWGEFEGRIWLDDSGVMLKSVLKMPFGTITAVRDDVAPAG